MTELNLTECKTCKIPQKRIRKGNCYGNVNEQGRWWDGLVCPECRVKKSAEYARKRGHIPRSENHPHERTRKGFIAEKRAKEFFENIGFSVKQATQHGPDLTCEMNGIVWTVEVKLAQNENRDKPKFKPMYMVSGVHKKRGNDDLIAVVFDEGIYINSMKDHMKKCRSSGGINRYACGARGVNDYHKALLERLQNN